MANDADAIVVAGTGRVLAAPVGTAAPADLTTAYGAAWVEMGFTNENGVTFSDGKTVEDIAVWQGFYPVRQIVTAREGSVAFGLRQWDKFTVPLAFGGGVISTPTAGVFKYEPPEAGTLDERALSVEITDGIKKFRFFVPKGLVREGVETNFTRTSAADLPITMGVLGTDSAKPWYFLTNDTNFS